MKSKIYILLLLIPYITSAHVREDMDQANALYKEKKYDEALRIYDSLVQENFYDADIFYNMANTYYRKGDFAAAILYYEKAKKLEGDKEDIKHNLELANAHIVDKVETLPEIRFFTFWKNLIQKKPSEIWAIRAIVLLWLSFFLILLFLFFRTLLLKKIAFLFFLFFFSFSILLNYIAFRKFKDEQKKEAIVFSSLLYVKSAPDLQGSDQFIIHEGLKVEITQSVANWYEIKLADGKKGWVEKKYVREI
jgi:tetratricopeptide (TPR) repeat protein